jgi:RNA polymerase sigma-70 factor (ECF subfamily)
MADVGLSTRVSLLVRLREDPGDQDAWAVFVERYGRQMLAWCRHWKLQEADAQDVTQMVLLNLARTLPDFVYDPRKSFRGWLRTLTQRAWSDFLDQQRRGVRGSADSRVFDLLETVSAREDLVQRLQHAFDQELLEQAMEEVRQRVEPRTWEAFHMTAVQELPGADVAQRLGMLVGAVYRARSIVQKMLRETLARLDPSDQP